jgi:hypothetical protein
MQIAQMIQWPYGGVDGVFSPVRTAVRPWPVAARDDHPQPDRGRGDAPDQWRRAGLDDPPAGGGPAADRQAGAPLEAPERPSDGPRV